MNILKRIGKAASIIWNGIPADEDYSVTPDTKKRRYDVSSVSGNIKLWVRLHCSPTDAKFSIDGEVVTINGTLPLKEIK